MMGKKRNIDVTKKIPPSNISQLTQILFFSGYSIAWGKLGSTKFGGRCN